MAFIRQTKCSICGEVKPIFVDKGSICEDCRCEMAKEEKLKWMNTQNKKTSKDRIKFLENFIYDNFISNPRGKKSHE